jgi:hypothetical protein
LQLEPPGSGGLLPALHLWYRHLSRGMSHLGDVQYVGALPDRSGQLRDVVSCNTDGVQVQFWFDRSEGFLTGMELFTAADTDPCEVRFGDWRHCDKVLLPHLWEVSCGDTYRARVSVESCRFTDREDNRDD